MGNGSQTYIRLIVASPFRQWVLSPPHPLRYRIAYDSSLLAALIRIFIRAIFSSLRRRARDCGIPRGQCGAVAFVQRFGSGVNLHPHVHVLLLDGVFAGLEKETRASIPYVRRMIQTSPPWLKRRPVAHRRY